MHWLQAPIITTALKDSSSLSTNTVITADLDLQQFVSKKRINRRHSSPHISYSPGPEPPPCTNTLCGFQLSFLYSYPPQTGLKTGQPTLWQLTMNMDTGPQDVRMRVIHSKPKLWHTTGVCLQPLLPTFPHVCSFIHTTNNCQICWLYHSSRSEKDNDETAHRDEVRHLSDWGYLNNLDLNSTETKKFIVVSVTTLTFVYMDRR